MDNKVFIKTDDNTLINEKNILWIKKMNECMDVCAKKTGCDINNLGIDTHKICKKNNLTNYNNLNKLFD
jgi:hypothetical protein